MMSRESSPRRCTLSLTLSLIATALLISALGLWVTVEPARADTPNRFAKVTGSGTACTQSSPCSLQAAVSLAAKYDVIWVAGGTYTGTGAAVITLTRSLALYGGWDGVASGTPARNPTAYPTTLDGENLRRVIYIGAATVPTIDGFTITRGNSVGQGGAGWSGGVGAGIYSESADPIITSNIITGNTILTASMTAGAGIFLAHASAWSIIEGNTVVSNTTGSGSGTGYGGGIFLFEADTPVSHNTIQENCADIGSGIDVYYGAPLISGNLVQNNCGTGMEALGSGATIRGNQFLHNHASGISIYRAPVTIDGNVIAFNTSNIGAGIISGNEDTFPFTIMNNFIYSNTATSAGGGFYIFSSVSYPGPGTGMLLHNTFANNTPDGIFVTANSTVALTNNIIVSSTIGICAGSALSVTVSADHSLFYGNSGGNTSGAGCPGSVTSTTPLTALPLFVNPASGDLHLRAGSPAIDAGALTSVTTDIDGNPRSLGARPDIGADEFIPLSYLPLVRK